MKLLEDIADSLATKALALANDIGDDAIVTDVAKELGNSSTTLEEAYLTAVRYRKAEIRAESLIRERAATNPAKTAE